MHIVGGTDLSYATMMALPVSTLWRMLHSAIDRGEARAAERLRNVLRDRGEV